MAQWHMMYYWWLTNSGSNFIQYIFCILNRGELRYERKIPLKLNTNLRGISSGYLTMYFKNLFMYILGLLGICQSWYLNIKNLKINTCSLFVSSIFSKIKHISSEKLTNIKLEMRDIFNIFLSHNIIFNKRS